MSDMWYKLMTGELEVGRMSVSKWAYQPEKCDGDYCCGECDLCSKKYEGVEDDEDDEV